MRILVTNDDGIDSIGLHVLARSLRDLGEVLVVAPDGEYSGSSAAFGAINLIEPTGHRSEIEGIDEAYSVSGPPALCVLFACLGTFGPLPDLVVAGINPGANVGRSIYHSGTIGAAVTARSRGISGVAVSQDVAEVGIEGQGGEAGLALQRWETAAQIAVEAARGLLERPGGAPLVLNLNVPNLPRELLAGWRYAEVGTIPQRALASARLQPREGHEGGFRILMEFGASNVLPISVDGGAVSNGYVAVTWLSPTRHEFDPGHEGACAVEQTLSGLMGAPILEPTTPCW